MVRIKDIDELQELARTILSMARAQGAEQAQVLVDSSENIATRYGENHITQNTQDNSLEFTLTTQIGTQVGIYGGTAAATDKLPSMIGDAMSLVKYSPPDPEFPGFLDVKREYSELRRDIVEYEPEEIADMIKIGVDNAISVDSKIAAVAGSINYTIERTVFANSHGIELDSYRSTLSGIVNVAARENDNESRSSDAVAGIRFDDLKMDSVSTDVAERAIRGLDQGELEVGAYPSILGHSAFMELMFHFGLAASSSMLINHQSPFKDKMGQQLFDERLTITDTTDDPSHYSSQKFDFDGEPSPRVEFIEQGILKNFAYNRRNAMKLGVENNGKGVGGFALFTAPSVAAGTRSEEELIGSIDNGVFVSNLWYTNFVNMPDGSITGLTKDGVFRIKNGEIVGSVKNMRFTDTLFSMFENCEPASNVMSKLHSTYGNLIGLSAKLPSIKVEKFNFSSKGKH